jgi:hypothetical protein
VPVDEKNGSRPAGLSNQAIGKDVRIRLAIGNLSDNLVGRLLDARSWRKASVALRRPLAIRYRRHCLAPRPLVQDVRQLWLNL